MAAIPVSPESLYNVARFAFELCQSCRAAKGHFERVGKAFLAMKTAVELVALELEDKQAPVNKLDTDSKTKIYFKQLGIHIGNCQQALQIAQGYLYKYNRMAAWQQLRWGWRGKEEIDSLVADISSVATQLDSFVGALNMKNIGTVLGRISRIEQSLELNGGDEVAVRDNIMADMTNTGISSQILEKYQNSIKIYAQEANKPFNAINASARRKFVEFSRERKESDATLASTSTQFQPRSQSADTVKLPTFPIFKRSHLTDPPEQENTNRSNNQPPTLECWLVQIKAGNFNFLAWQNSGKECQLRGQSQLEEMAKQFWASKTSKYTDEYDLVGWVVDDRQKAEPDPKHYIWRPYAAKLERKGGTLLLDSGVEEQAMVIISRSPAPIPTSSSQHINTDSKMALAAHKDAARKNAKAEAAQLKKEAKIALARRKSEDAAFQRAEKEKREKFERETEVRHLKQQVLMLKLNQQPTLADKPEAIVEKKRTQKMAREKTERDRLLEMQERKANLRKVRVALGTVEDDCGDDDVGKGKGKERERESWIDPPQPAGFTRCGVANEGRLQATP